MTKVKKTKFELATKAEKRVIIAKDVILQIKAKKFKATSNVYIRPSKKFSEFGKFTDSLKDVLPAFFESGATCSCCAKGALFISTVSKRNECTIDETKNLGSYEIVQNLSDIFTESQLDKIEQYFEGWVGEYDIDYPDTDNRLIVICNNIIKNNGTFKP